jgi:hypothetical protein
MLATIATFPATSLIFPATAPTRRMTGKTFFCKKPFDSGFLEAEKLMTVGFALIKVEGHLKCAGFE